MLRWDLFHTKLHWVYILSVCAWSFHWCKCWWPYQPWCFLHPCSALSAVSHLNKCFNISITLTEALYLDLPALKEGSKGLINTCLYLVTEDLKIEKDLGWLSDTLKVTALKRFLELSDSIIKKIFLYWQDDINLVFDIWNLNYLALFT